MKGIVGEANFTCITLLVHRRANVLVDAHVFVDLVRLGRFLVGNGAPEHGEVKTRNLSGNGDWSELDNSM